VGIRRWFCVQLACLVLECLNVDLLSNHWWLIITRQVNWQHVYNLHASKIFILELLTCLQIYFQTIDVFYFLKTSEYTESVKLVIHIIHKWFLGITRTFVLLLLWILTKLIKQRKSI